MVSQKLKSVEVVLLLLDDATVAIESTPLNGDVDLMEPGLSATPAGCITPNWKENANSRRGRFALKMRLIDNEALGLMVLAILRRAHGHLKALWIGARLSHE